VRLLGLVDAHPELRARFDGKYPDRGDESWQTRPGQLVEIRSMKLVLREWCKGGVRTETYIIEENRRPHPLRLAWKLLVSMPLSAAAIPVLVAAAFVLWQGATIRWAALPAVFVSAVLLEIGILLTGDHSVLVRGGSQTIPGPRSAPGGPVFAVSAMERLVGGLAALLLGGFLGLLLIAMWGWPLVPYALAVPLIWVIYFLRPELLRRVGVAEGAALVVLGPVMVTGTVAALTGRPTWTALSASIPIGCLGAAMVSLGGTLSLVSGLPAPATGDPSADSPRLRFLVLNAIAFLLTLAWIQGGNLPAWTYITLLVLPLAAWSVSRLYADPAADPEERIYGIAARTFTAYGVLLALGLLLGWAGW